jgi:lipid-A-disaccharide synthase
LRYEPADLFFAAGEASGDLEGSLLAAAAKRLRPSLTLRALGGARLASAGAELLYDTTELASIGPLSIAPKIPKLWLLLRRLDRWMRAQPVGVFLPVDAGAFNLRLAALLRAGGYSRPIIYYFPPGAWLDNAKKARAVAGCTLPLTPFAHQRDFYKSLGLRIEYFGHPLVSVIFQRPPKRQGSSASIAVLPGSRREEVAHHIPVLAPAAAELARASTVSFFAVASSAERAQQIEQLWKRHKGPPLGMRHDGAAPSLAPADVAWVASGTAVLEAALVGVPQITFYKISRAQYRIALRTLPQHILARLALPNIILNRDVVPELLQDDFTAVNVRNKTLELLESEARRERQIAAYQEFRHALGPPDALDRIADFVLAQLDGATGV